MERFPLTIEGGSGLKELAQGRRSYPARLAMGNVAQAAVPGPGFGLGRNLLEKWLVIQTFAL
jgi:hypothetical protein